MVFSAFEAHRTELLFLSAASKRGYCAQVFAVLVEIAVPDYITWSTDTRPRKNYYASGNSLYCGIESRRHAKKTQRLKICACTQTANSDSRDRPISGAEILGVEEWYKYTLTLVQRRR